MAAAALAVVRTVGPALRPAAAELSARFAARGMGLPADGALALGARTAALAAIAAATAAMAATALAIVLAVRPVAAIEIAFGPARRSAGCGGFLAAKKPLEPGDESAGLRSSRSGG